jgi:UDP-glucose 4-epimerase
MKVLITGGAGFLGSHLADALLTRGDEVCVLDPAPADNLRHHRGHPRLHYVRSSVLHTRRLEAWLAPCDLIYHFAAVVGVAHYVGDPYRVLHVNINGTQAVLRLAWKYGKKVVFSSTSEVYGRSPQLPFEEDGARLLGSTRIARWCYATAKQAGEHFCFAFHRRGLPVVVLRYFNVYGPRMDQRERGRVIPIFLGQLRRGEPLTVIGDGRQTRCFTYVADAIRATLAAGGREAAVGEVVNIGSAEEVSIQELAALLIQLAGGRARLQFVPAAAVYGPGYEDIPRRVPSLVKMEQLLGVVPEVPLAEGLRRTLAWFQQAARAADGEEAWR